MNTIDIVLLLVVLLVAALGYLLATHKLTLAKIEGLAAQLHMVHGAVVAPAAAAPAPAPAPIASELPAPAPAAVQTALPAPTPLPGPTGGLSPMVAAMTGGTGGNVDANTANLPPLPAGVLISDESVLNANGTKFRTPKGVKPFTLDVEQGQNYMMTTSEGHALVDVAVKRPNGSTLVHADHPDGILDLRFKADLTGTVAVIVTFSGEATDAGIAVHKIDETPDTSNLTGK